MSIGVAVGPFPNGTQALQWADSAMYRAKRAGGGICYYDEALHAETRWQLQIQDQLPAALRRVELTLHYQPIVQLGSRRVREVEALLRWQHPEQGLLPPQQFLPIAERLGYAEQIEQWVLAHGCADLIRMTHPARQVWQSDCAWR